MGGMKTNKVTSRVLMLGDNHFHTAKIKIAANTTLVEGAVLKRGADADTFAVAAAGDDFAAVNPFEIVNDTAAEKTFSFQACFDGRVREDMLRVGAATVSVTDIDKLRKVGILPMKVTDLSHLDNH